MLDLGPNIIASQGGRDNPNPTFLLHASQMAKTNLSSRGEQTDEQDHDPGHSLDIKIQHPEDPRLLPQGNKPDTYTSYETLPEHDMKRRINTLLARQVKNRRSAGKRHLTGPNRPKNSRSKKH